MADRDMIIRGCEYWIKNHKGEELILEYTAVEDLLAVLKEQDAVVRCKDCKWWHESETEERFGDCGQANGIALKPSNWYCADGERRVIT